MATIVLEEDQGRFTKREGQPMIMHDYKGRREQNWVKNGLRNLELELLPKHFNVSKLLKRKRSRNKSFKNVANSL